jgi:hypothetical protein
MASGSTSCRNVSTSTHVGYVYKILKIVGGWIHSCLKSNGRKSSEQEARCKMPCHTKLYVPYSKYCSSM